MRMGKFVHADAGWDLKNKYRILQQKKKKKRFKFSIEIDGLRFWCLFRPSNGLKQMFSNCVTRSNILRSKNN